jgi:hypothetical protein
MPADEARGERRGRVRAAGMDNDAMQRRHVEFERRAPEAHHLFLIPLGIDEKETQLIRKLSDGGGNQQGNP